MSISPLPPSAAVVGTPTDATGATADHAATGFAALVAGLLAQAAVPQAVVAPPPAPAEPEHEESAGEDAAPGTEAAAAAGPQPVVPLTSAPLHLLGAVAAGRPGGGDTSPVAGSAATAVSAPPSAPVTPAAAGTYDAGTASEPAPATTTPSSSPRDLPVTAAEPSGPTPAPGPTPPAVPTVPAPSAPSVGPSTSTTDHRPLPVATQLGPEVTRLVSRGDGVHRLTMRLQPEALGEVRVTLTLRHGEVHVRLAAGDEAQRALAEGAPELRRVLELAGASDPRIVVRDLSGTPGPTSPSTAPAPGGGGGRDDAFTPGTGGGGGHDQHAGTRGGTTARDGLTDGASPPRPEPARRSPRGLDLSM